MQIWRKNTHILVFSVYSSKRSTNICALHISLPLVKSAGISRMCVVRATNIVSERMRTYK